MKVLFGDCEYEFQLWNREHGRVFNSAFSYDVETTLIDDDQPWRTPTYVLGAAFDGVKGVFVLPQDVPQFFAAHEGLPVVMHHAPFDLDVIATVAPDLDIYRWVEKNRVWDTQLLHRLFCLASDGHTANRKGESTLEHCTRLYYEMELPKDALDSMGDPVRLSYAKWQNVSFPDIEPVYLDYLAQDAIATRLLQETLRSEIKNLLHASKSAWGYVSHAWLAEQVRRWGWLTHHIQLRAAIVLKAITRNGLHLDLERRGKLSSDLQGKLDEQLLALFEFGYHPGKKGSGKALQAIIKGLEQEHGNLVFKRTATGKYGTSYEAIQEMADTIPFLRLLLEYRETAKLQKTYVSKMAKESLHPSFNVLARSGRTTSHGEINAQNLPKDDRVRNCFIPAPGHVYIDADYSTIEMATLAQSCMSQFGLPSKMAEAINAGQDLHTLVASRVTGKPEQNITSEERGKAKPMNFGKPGAMGDAALCNYAKASYGVSLTDEEVRDFSQAWFQLFPEMVTFLDNSSTTDPGSEVAKLLQLTPESHHQHTGDLRFLNHPENVDHGDQPHRILGWMLLKALNEKVPTTGKGDPYSPHDIDYFWEMAKPLSRLLPPKHRTAILTREPSSALRRAVFALVGRGSVFTLTGRLRADATFAARHNTVFQGLASDGAKLGLWLVWRAGYRIVNFVHDEVVVEVPSSSNLRVHAERISALLVRGMTLVVPDVAVGVEFAAMNRWHKGAKAIYGKNGNLIPWEPETPKKVRRVV